jgi:hypothetical protein
LRGGKEYMYIYVYKYLSKREDKVIYTYMGLHATTWDQDQKTQTKTTRKTKGRSWVYLHTGPLLGHPLGLPAQRAAPGSTCIKGNCWVYLHQGPLLGLPAKRTAPVSFMNNYICMYIIYIYIYHYIYIYIYII